MSARDQPNDYRLAVAIVVSCVAAMLWRMSVEWQGIVSEWLAAQTQGIPDWSLAFSALAQEIPRSGYLAVGFAFTGVLTWDMALGSGRLAGDRSELLRFSWITAQLATLAWLFNFLSVVDVAFYRSVFPLAAAGFCVHHAVPVRHRLPVFVFLSLTAFLVVLQWEAGLAVIAVGMTLIGLCHLPIAFRWRLAAVAVVGLGLGLARGGLLEWPLSAAMWPVLGSMFMFRLTVYLHHVRYHDEPFDPWRALGYFFLLPNVLFPLFPVVDYGTYKRTYYDRDCFVVYQEGVRWLVIGLVQLLAYRLVYQQAVVPAADVATATDFARHVVANFALYLRVSGQFHLIVGILHLFGFRLPPTHHFFFLASSFTDFWRRINIYWKDFMLKLFFNPVYFRFRRRGHAQGLVVATLTVFVMTWALHSYQWFWIRGSFLLSAPDVLFWGMLAVMVLANTLFEAKKGRPRSLTRGSWSLGGDGLTAVKTVGFFILISTMWSMWSSPTITEWLIMVRRIQVTAEDVVTLGAALTALAVFTAAAQQLIRIAALPSEGMTRPFLSSARLAASGLVLLIVPIAAADLLPFGSRGMDVFGGVVSGRLNAADAAQLQRGYYEDLTDVVRFNTPLWDLYQEQGGQGVGALRATGNFLNTAVRPSVRAFFSGGNGRTNRHGMRDRLYSIEKPSETFRIALLGQSVVLGLGVNDGETFEAVLEDRMNREHSAAEPDRFELLNFGISNIPPTAQIVLLNEKVRDFGPDVVFFFGHHTDGEKSALHLVERYREGTHIPFPYLSSLLSEAGVTQDATVSVGEARLVQFRDEIVRWAYETLVEDIRAAGAQPVAVFHSLPGDPIAREDEHAIAALARESGFTVLDLADTWDGLDIRPLRISDVDWHPTAAGHVILAERLYQALLATPGLVPFSPTPPGADQPNGR